MNKSKLADHEYMHNDHFAIERWHPSKLKIHWSSGETLSCETILDISLEYVLNYLLKELELENKNENDNDINRGLNDEDLIKFCNYMKKYGMNKLKQIE